MIAPIPPLPPALDQALHRELIAGERLVWQAQPLARRQMRGFLGWAFAIPWTAFSLAWEVMAFLPWMSSSRTPDQISLTFGIAMPLFGLPFVLIGLWMMWQPIRAVRETGRTVYGLTNRRMIRLVKGRSWEVSSVMLDQIGPIQRDEAGDGSGHLSIQTHSHIDSDGDRITEKFIVTGVPEVARLERLIMINRAA